ncbi:hypothetical protein [Granulicoccus sp. GXG6511]
MQIRRRMGGGAFACAIALTAGTLAQTALRTRRRFPVSRARLAR